MFVDRELGIPLWLVVGAPVVAIVEAAVFPFAWLLARRASRSIENTYRTRRERPDPTASDG